MNTDNTKETWRVSFKGYSVKGNDSNEVIFSYPIYFGKNANEENMKRWLENAEYIVALHNANLGT